MRTLQHVPTGCNVRHLTFRVVSTRAKLDEFRERMLALLFAKELTLPPFLKRAVEAVSRQPQIDPFSRGAPHLLIVEGSPKAVCPVADCIAACAYFDILAQGSGLGSTWCGFLSVIVGAVPEVREIFGIAPGAPFFSMLFGKPAVTYARTAARPDGAKIEFM